MKTTKEILKDLNNQKRILRERRDEAPWGKQYYNFHIYKIDEQIKEYKRISKK